MNPRLNVFERAKRNIELLVERRLAENSARPISGEQQSRPGGAVEHRNDDQELQDDPISTLEALRVAAVNEQDPIKRAELFAKARAMADASDLKSLSNSQSEALRLAAKSEHDPLKRALLHQRAERRA
jgi:hypothetical protein